MITVCLRRKFKLKGIEKWNQVSKKIKFVGANFSDHIENYVSDLQNTGFVG
jgi:hypothetical protein